MSKKEFIEAYAKATGETKKTTKCRKAKFKKTWTNETD